MNAKNIFGAVTVAIAMFFVWPGVIGSFAEMSALKTALAERQQLVADRTGILATIGTEYAKYQQVTSGDAGKLFISLVPVRKSTAELVSAIQDIAATSGMQLAEIQVSEAVPKETDVYKTISISLSLTGSYVNFRTFLADLEQYVRILNIGSVDISTDSSTGELAYIVKADSYFIK